MPEWMLPALAAGYAAITVLVALAAAFSHETARRNAAYKVLKALLPWGFLLTLLDLRLSGTNQP